MQTHPIVPTWTLIALCALLATSASAHPGSGIVVDKEGQVFFTDTGHGVCKIDAKGKLTDVPASAFHWMAIDESGRFAESPRSFGDFERVTLKGSKAVLILCSDFPVTVDGDGNLYYAHTRPSSGRIIRRTADGKETVLARDAKFENIAGITCSPEGSVYVTETSPNAIAIRKVTMDGVVSTIASDFGPKDTIRNQPPETLAAAYCRGLDVDAAGVVYVAATGSRRVLRITPQGEVSTILEAPSPWQPTGVALFDGEVYVLEWHEPAASQLEDRAAWLPRVRKIARDGTVSTLATVSR